MARIQTAGAAEACLAHDGPPAQVWAKAEDGVGVPVSMLYRKDKLRLDGEGMPALMEAYGAYGDSFEPSFNAGRLSLLDR